MYKSILGAREIRGDPESSRETTRRQLRSSSRGDLRGRCTGIEKLGNGGDELRGRERLGQKDAVGNAVRTIFVGAGAGHVNDGKIRVDLSGKPGDFPTAHTAAQIDVGHQRAVFGRAALEQRHRLFARSGNSRFKAAIAKRVFNDALNRLVVFNDENDG
jgi:hypothetical protein